MKIGCVEYKVFDEVENEFKRLKEIISDLKWHKEQKDIVMSELYVYLENKCYYDKALSDDRELNKLLERMSRAICGEY